MIRSANISPNDLSAFVDEYRAGLTQTAKPGGAQDESSGAQAPQIPAPNIAAASRGKEDV